jgi:uncharacterized protein (DUF1778 family)
MTDGITDAEWFHGCRCVEHSLSQYKLTEALKSRLDLLTKEEWSELISSLDEPGIVPNNKFVSTFKRYDKWDTNRPIY